MRSFQQQEYARLPETESSDGSLVKLARTGDQRAFETLVKRYRDHIFRYSYNILKDKDQTDDVLQFVFLQLYLCLPKLAIEGSLKAWLFRVARNRCFDTLRKHRHQAAMSFSALVVDETEDDISPINSIMDPNPLPEEVVMTLEIQSYLQRALFTLPPSLQAIVHLHSFKHLSFTEIARILNIPQPTVKTYFYRSLPRLRSALMKDDYFIAHHPSGEAVPEKNV